NNWKNQEDSNQTNRESMIVEDFKENYDVIFDGDEHWQNRPVKEGTDYEWNDQSSYIQEVPFFKDISETPEEPENIHNARALLHLGDSITTDHISPAGAFRESSAAGQYLVEQGVSPLHFNSYGSRRGIHNVMMRGTFANVRLKNKLV